MTMALATPVWAHSHEAQERTTGPKLENLMQTALEGVENTEIMVSRVTVPPNSALPKHWHPGEEFAYVLEGSVTLWQKGKEDTLIGPGEVAKVPLKQIHTAVTGEEGAVILVFRVHEEGQPERILAEE
ncbi:MAG: cupin domain-containing protein [Alphaproteobacteria bacterium]|nr:MAG: cupin domain-containing protein [Alphaproteobacteria bacterium]